MWQTLLAGLLASVFFQATDRWYEGKWSAEFEGVTFVRLELALVNGKPAGRMSLGNSIEVNADGGLRSVSPASGRFAEIFDVTVNGPVFAFSQRDGAEINRFEIHQAADHAELRVVLSDETRKELAAEGSPVPRPIQLRREQNR